MCQQGVKNMPHYFRTNDVYYIWKQCIQYDIIFPNPYLWHTETIYIENMDMLKMKIMEKKRKADKGLFFVKDINFSIFDKATYNDKKDIAAAFVHEVRMNQLAHKRCYKCQGVSLVKEYHAVRSSFGAYHCDECRRHTTDTFWKQGNDMLLPVWYDDYGKVQFQVPEELKNLRLGEQLLIQRLSCFVPIVHIKHGVMGLHGNCVCFRQDLIEICNVLPRTRVNAIKIIRSYDSQDNNGIQDVDMFIIRRTVVLKALIWLKRYHKWYREDPDLIICEANLDWMEGQEERCLVGTNAVTANNIESKEFDSPMHEQDDKDRNGKKIDEIVFIQYV